LFLSFRNGTQTFIDALVARLPPGSLHCGVQVHSLAPTTSNRWSLELSNSPGVVGVPDRTASPSDDPNGSTLEADAVCVALPAYAASPLLRSFAPDLSALMTGIPYAASATLNLAFRRADVAHPLDGFGFVVPAIEKRSLLGCTFSSTKFPGRAPEGRVLLRAFIGESGLADRDDPAVIAAVLSELTTLLGISAAPLFTTLWRAIRAMPHYLVGHLDRVAQIETILHAHPSLALAGNAYRGIGLPDCVHSGEQAAERLFNSPKSE
jgi:oxygen-dependent protoporphyrinogen oxidase